MKDVSRGLVERLAGHPGIGSSSRTAQLSVMERGQARVRKLTENDPWKVAHATDLGDGCHALTLISGDGADDATAIVRWDRFENMHVDACTDESARTFLCSSDGEYAAYHAAFFGRYGA